MKDETIVEVENFAYCRYCGAKNVAWVESRKNGKMYLAKAYNDRGVVYADRGNPHKCNR